MSKKDTPYADDVWGPNSHGNVYKPKAVVRAEKILSEMYSPPDRVNQAIRGGTKFDSDKLKWHLLPVAAVTEIVKVLNFGANKYAAWNWSKGIDYSRLYSSSQRHLNAWWEGEEVDPETGIHHLAHLGCCVLFLLTFCLKQKAYKVFDDRACWKAFLNDKGE